MNKLLKSKLFLNVHNFKLNTFGIFSNESDMNLQSNDIIMLTGVCRTQHLVGNGFGALITCIHIMKI